jgi:hypothetical protein
MKKHELNFTKIPEAKASNILLWVHDSNLKTSVNYVPNMQYITHLRASLAKGQTRFTIKQLYKQVLTYEKANRIYQQD